MRFSAVRYGSVRCTSHARQNGRVSVALTRPNLRRVCGVHGSRLSLFAVVYFYKLGLDYVEAASV